MQEAALPLVYTFAQQKVHVKQPSLIIITVYVEEKEKQPWILGLRRLSEGLTRHL